MKNRLGIISCVIILVLSNQFMMSIGLGPGTRCFICGLIGAISGILLAGGDKR